MTPHIAGQPLRWIPCQGPITLGTLATMATESSRRIVRAVASKPGFVMFAVV